MTGGSNCAKRDHKGRWINRTIATVSLRHMDIALTVRNSTQFEGGSCHLHYDPAVKTSAAFFKTPAWE